MLKIVTTSWDDGDPKDLRVPWILHSRGLTGTFSVPLTGYRGAKTLCDADLKSLSRDFEIGAHSISHKTLRHLRSEELDREVSLCKYKLQEIVGNEITMFCYPNGYYDRKVVAAVKRAGYAGARTCRMFSNGKNLSAFEMPTTIQAFAHSPVEYLRNIANGMDIPLLWRYINELSRFRNWLELGKHMFDRMLEQGGVWHLYGHSWELEQRQLWRQLEEMLDYVAHREDVIYLTNGGVLPIVSRAGITPGNARPIQGFRLYR